MALSIFGRCKKFLPFLALVCMALVVVNCKSEVSSKQQQKAFHVKAATMWIIAENRSNEI